MDRFFRWIGLTMMAIWTVVIFAAVAVAQDVIPPVSETDLRAFLMALGGAKTLSTLGIVGLVVQAIMLFLKSSLGEITGKWQLSLVLIFTFVGGIIGLKSGGMDWGAVLVHSSTIGAAQVLMHQIYKQFMVKKE